LQRRHFTGLKSALKVCGYPFLFRAVNSSALDTCAKGSLDRRQDSVAAFHILPVLLISTEPERRVNADEYQDQLCHPSADT
jgi:hypothetical protein